MKSPTRFLLAAVLALIPAAAEAKWETVPDTLILVNQVGYDTAEVKTVLLQSKRPLPEGALEFQLVAADGKPVHAGRFGPAVRHSWGKDVEAWYRRGDFTDFRAPGIYRVIVRLGEREESSSRFEIGDKVLVRRTACLAVEFFDAQRCGGRNALHGPCHLNDAVLRDGKRQDATGGWHDAGNHPKHPTSSSLGTYALARFAGSPGNARFTLRRAGLPTAKEEALWGGVFLLKVQDPATGRYLGIVDGPGRESMPAELFEKCRKYREQQGRAYTGTDPDDDDYEYWFPPEECAITRQCGTGGLPTVRRFDVYSRETGSEALVLGLPNGPAGDAPIPFALGQAEVRACLKEQKAVPLTEGVPVYLDRPRYTVKEVPEALRGAVLIQTLNDLKDQTAAGGLALILTRPARVFVLAHPGGEGDPKWILESGFTRQDATCVVEAKQVSKGWARRTDELWRFRTYAKDCPAGEVLLGANHGPGYVGEPGACTYAVVVKEVSVGSPTPLVANIGHRLSPMSPPKQPMDDAPVYLSDATSLRPPPKKLASASFYQGLPRWKGTGWSISIRAGTGTTVGLCVTEDDASAMGNTLDTAGLRKLDVSVECWRHSLTVGKDRDWNSWSTGFTRSNGYTAAGLACLYRLTSDDKYWDAAVRLWGTMVNDPSDSACDAAVLMADLEMHCAREEKRFLDDAAVRVHRLLAAQADEGGWDAHPGGYWGAIESEPASALASYVLAVPTGRPATDSKVALARYVQWCRTMSDNPFNLRLMDREGKAAFLFSGGYAENARSLTLCSRILDGKDAEDARRMAAASVDWLLGLNTYGVCLMAGAGSKHMGRFLHYYYPDEMPGAMSKGIVMNDMYLDVRSRGLRRSDGDGQTGEPLLASGGYWMMLLSDQTIGSSEK